LVEPTHLKKNMRKSKVGSSSPQRGDFKNILVQPPSLHNNQKTTQVPSNDKGLIIDVTVAKRKIILLFYNWAMMVRTSNWWLNQPI